MAFPPITLLATVALVGLALYKFILYPAFFSPLAKIPNAHPTSPLSSAWILWIRWSRRENRTVHASHLKHGPIVRLGPNEVSVNSLDGGIRTVYAGSFEKGDWYSNMFTNYGGYALIRWFIFHICLCLVVSSICSQCRLTKHIPPGSAWCPTFTQSRISNLPPQRLTYRGSWSTKGCFHS